MKIINQKPIEIDAQFKYRCPNCGNEHWISIKQARVKGFKIVCDCDTVFQPKRIKKIVAVYSNRIIKNKPPPPCSTVFKEDKEVVETNKIPLEESTLEKCAKLLVQYGFTISESKKLIIQAYDRSGFTDIGQLMKNTLEYLGENKHE